MNCIWIDDEPKREIAAKNMADSLGILCEFINVKTKDDYLETLSKVKPDLILIDQNLTEIKTGDIKKGSTLAAIIREEESNTPIVCVTAQEIKDLESFHQSSFDFICSDVNIESNYPTIMAIAKGFRSIRSKPPKNSKELLSLIEAPEDEIYRLENIIPHSIKEKYNSNGVSSLIFDWVWNTLVFRPGFLYDRLWTATLLGVNLQGFSKIEAMFQSAKFEGVFSSQVAERWWKTKVISLLSDLVEGTDLPWVKGRKLAGLSTEDYSEDYFSSGKDDFPEVVAYIDQSSDVRRQMKLKYTVPHPRFDKLLYFDEIRMMRAE